MIIIDPCSPTRVRYSPGEKVGVVGRRSSTRISMAFRPPMKKKTAIPIRYWRPITLWSVLARTYRVQPVAPFARSPPVRPNSRATGWLKMPRPAR